MITDADIRKLKKVFATKDDLLGMESRFNRKFATKDDLKAFATKADIANALKAMEERLRRDIVKDVADMLQDSVIKILNQHEYRIDRLEKHVGGFPPIPS